MEHRDPPRILGEDHRPGAAASSTDPPIPPRRFPLGRSNRPRDDRRRLALLASLIAAATGLVYLGYRAVRAATDWLSDQNAYQIPFQSIQLDPVPPPWYRGGTARFLESVRRRADESGTLPVLKLESGRVKSAFLEDPWVDEVVKVTYPPQGLRVELLYREPVAWVKMKPDSAAQPSIHDYLVDEEATILPWKEDVDLKPLGRLITIRGEGLADPIDSRPGKPWKLQPGVIDLPPGNGLIPAAAKLAGFLTRKARSLGTSCPPALEFKEINVSDPNPKKHRGLFAFNGEDAAILWGEAPGDESLGSLTAEEKWALLREWSEQTPSRSVPKGDYWEFFKSPSQGGLRHVLTPRSGPASRDARPRKESVAAGSGQIRETVSH